jgi:hypothetical protein
MFDYFLKRVNAFGSVNSASCTFDGVFKNLGSTFTVTEMPLTSKSFRSTGLLDARYSASFEQGCQIFLDTIDQNGGKYTKLPLNCQMTIKYVYQMSVIYVFQMAVTYDNLFHFEALKKLTKLGFLV